MVTAHNGFFWWCMWNISFSILNCKNVKKSKIVYFTYFTWKFIIKWVNKFCWKYISVRSGVPLLEERYCPQLTHTIWQVMAVLLENVTNCVWQAFASLQQDKTGLVPKSKLKVGLFHSKASYTRVLVNYCKCKIFFFELNATGVFALVFSKYREWERFSFLLFFHLRYLW